MLIFSLRPGAWQEGFHYLFHLSLDKSWLLFWDISHKIDHHVCPSTNLWWMDFFSETWRWFFLIANKSIRNWKRTSLFFEQSSYWESEKYNLHNLILKFSLFLTSTFNPSFISINSLSSRVNVFRHTRTWSATLLKKRRRRRFFHVNFNIFLRKLSFTKHLRMTAFAILDTIDKNTWQKRRKRQLFYLIIKNHIKKKNWDFTSLPDCNQITLSWK